MASITGTTNSTSSLGNTSLRGFGGMASGIDRDSIIEQMTLGTTTKINNQKRKMTELQWKQEAYMGISDSIIDLTDKYASYSSSSNLKDPYAFAKNLISVSGKDDATRYVTATGSSALVDMVSIKGVSQLATSATLQSASHTQDGIKTNISDLTAIKTDPLIEGAKLSFGHDNPSGFENIATITFASSYTDENGTHTIDYAPTTSDEKDQFIEDLNKMVSQQLEGTDLEGKVSFSLDDNNRLQIQIDDSSVLINRTSSVLSAMGYSGGTGAVSANDFNANIKDYTSEKTALDYFTGQKVTINYNGTKKDIELITKDDAEELQEMIDNNEDNDTILAKFQEKLQGRINDAFGTEAVKVDLAKNVLSLNTLDKTSSLSITASDNAVLKNLGLVSGSSNKVNTGGKLDQFSWWEDMKTQGGLDENDKLNIEINGKKIDGLSKDSTISDILSKINSSDAGVKATYIDATGQFVLIASETGAGREISVSGALAEKLFSNPEDENNGSKDGQNAKIQVSYGNGVDVTLERSSNTFNLEGLSVTVSGIFGGDWNDTGIKAQTDGNGNYTDADGKILDPNKQRVNSKGNIETWEEDSSETVTFSAKADVDAAVEKVKSFFEDFNALVTEINGHVTTRPDSKYTALTDEQKAQMDETSIKNWETKAKQGILYGDSIMRDLSMDMQSIYTKLMSYGFSYEDLQEVGITYSQDWGDGGTLVFDESKFRSAMESDPDKVAKVFNGGESGKGLIHIVEDTVTPYATRYAAKNGNTYGRLVEMAGTNKKPTTLMNNEIYKQLKEMDSIIESLQERLATEQDRYISQFTMMESLLNKMNTQSSYLSQITG